MDITTNDNWQWVGDDFKVAFATTSDPRVVAVIEREEDASFEENLDGDAIPPCYLIDRNRADHVGGFDDDEALANRIIEAEDRFRYAAGYRYNGLSWAVENKAEALLRRWAWVFHGTALHRGSYGYGNGYDVLVMSTPAFREHIGHENATQDEAQKQADVTAGEARKIADGDVFGVGWATNVGRVMDDGEKVDPTDDPWTMSIECWGFIGEKYAQGEAADFSYGDPDLDPMLDGDVFTDHTDRMAELAVRDAELADRGW